MGRVFSSFPCFSYLHGCGTSLAPSFSRNVLRWWDTSRALSRHAREVFVGQPLSSGSEPLTLDPSLVDTLCHSGGVAELIASKKVSGDEKDCTIEFNP